MKEEIQSSDWKVLCERLNAFERGQLVTAQIVEHDGTRREIGSALLLESIEFKRLNGCNDAVVVRAMDGFEHTAIEPIHIRLVKNPSGGFNPVEIDAEGGSVLLHFKPALTPAVLEGLNRVGWAGAAR
ncbi:MAG TPA: DUF5335 family protein [Candidatus Acidoferrum sp.]|nr:DUF5335 family protein [Candidatus Acidoferrum sp.]